MPSFFVYRTFVMPSFFCIQDVFGCIKSYEYTKRRVHIETGVQNQGVHIETGTHRDGYT
jgi:hypothetical protein